MYFLRLIRFPNLLIIVLTQYLMRWCVISPMLKVYGFELQFGEFHFFLLVLATLLITAGGYVINDYFDRKTDMINKPDQVIVGRHVNRRAAMAWHILLNVMGIAIGFYLALIIGFPVIGIVFIMIGGVLWFYSTSYKRQFIIGNVVVAFLTGLVPLMVVLFELPMLNRTYHDILVEYNTNFNVIVRWVSGFALFAFLTTLIREIIKDTEDLEGDNAYGRNSIPIVIGIFWTKFIIIVLSVVTMGLLIYIYLTHIRDMYTFIYILFLLLIPFVFLIVIIARANGKRSYGLASLLMKLIMISGVLYSVVLNFTIDNHFHM